MRGGIALLLACIHQGYRAHPDVQAWAAAQSLEETFRLAVSLGTVDQPVHPAGGVNELPYQPPAKPVF